MSHTISEQLDARIRSLVDSGRYQSAGEVLDVALGLLEERDEFYAYRLEKLRAMVRAGDEQIERGETVSFDAESFIKRMREQRASLNR